MAWPLKECFFLKQILHGGKTLKKMERQIKEIKYDDVQETERSLKHQKMSVYPNRAVGSSARRRG